MLRLIVTLLLSVLAQQILADEPEAIFGGSEVAPGELPYQCSLNSEGNHFCGCSIISETKILTAAHCVQSSQAPFTNLVVRTGSIDKWKGNENAIKSIALHPDFDSKMESLLKNDIAIITLEKPITFTANEYPVRLNWLPPQGGTQCVLSGWGVTPTEYSPQYLLKMNTMLYTHEDCKNMTGLALDPTTHLCAMNKKGIGACLGDSGGPLVCNGIQYGVTSFIQPCATGSPDIFTDVYQHYRFIYEELRK